MSDRKIGVMLVDDIADTRENMKKLLFFEDDIEVVGTAGTGEEGIELARRIRPDIVIMDINMPGIDGITAAEIMTRELPGIQIIMMSVQGDSDYLRRSMLAGAREFLIKPPTADEIITSIRRVYALSQNQRNQMAMAPAASAPAAIIPSAQAPTRKEQVPARRGEVIAVFGAKGGVGTSSITVNLAIALQERKKEARVAVLDGNTEFGDLSVLLNLNATRTIIDLISVEDLEPQYIEDVLVPHSSGIRVMPGSSPAESELVTNEQLRRVIEALRTTCDYVVFDTRPTFNEPILTILDMADTIVLVTTGDIPSIRNARLFFEVADQLRYPKSKIKLVLNKYDPQTNVSAQAIQSSVKHPISVTLPRDDRTAGSAIQQGLPYVVGSGRAPLSTSTHSLARVLLGEDVEAPSDTVRHAQPAEKTPAKKTGLFSRLFGR